MPRYKPSDCHALMLPVVLSEQIVPGSFAFALTYLIDQEFDLSALDARFKNDSTRAFIADNAKRLNSKGQELKSNATAPDSAKMATNKGVIQGYAAQAAVDSAHQIIIAADVVGSGSEQAMLAPMIEQAKPWSDANTLVTADAGYHSDANVQQLHDSNTPALIADNQMRKRDERFEGQDKYKAKPDPLSDKKAAGQAPEGKHFRPKDFKFNDDNTATCPAGKVLISTKGSIYLTASGQPYQT